MNMTKKRAANKQVDLNVGNLSDVSGNVNIAGGKITTYQTTTGLNTAEIKQLFNQVYSAIEIRAETPSADKEDLKAEAKEIQSTVTEATQKNEKVDEGFLPHRLILHAWRRMCWM